MNPDRTPKTRPVWPTLQAEIARRISGLIQASWALQPKRCLLDFRMQEIPKQNKDNTHFRVL